MRLTLFFVAFWTEAIKRTKYKPTYNRENFSKEVQ